MSAGKACVVRVTMRAEVDGREFAVERTYRERVLDEATAELIVEELCQVFEHETGLEPAEPESVE